ncbi:MAG: transglutaminase family protein [Bacteroidota bacterium]
MLSTQSDYFFDYHEPSVKALIEKIELLPDAREKVIALYYFVRDKWRYNPYIVSFRKEDYKVSRLIHRSDGNCLTKSLILIGLYRACGIPANLLLAKVKNHIAVERLTEKFGTTEMAPHGMVNVQVDGNWFKCSPAFNKELCEIYHVDPLEFDGESDSIFQEFNKEGKEFMEYTENYGEFEEVPIQKIKEIFISTYPELMKAVDGDYFDISKLAF